MIRHLLKLAWNRRKKNFILGIEILISFLVLFAIFSIGINFLLIYLKNRGFEYEKVYCVGINWQNESNRAILQKKEQIAVLLSQYNDVESYGFSMNNVPFSQSQWQTGYKYGNQEILSEVFYIDDSFFDVLSIKHTSGSVFSNEMDANKVQPVIINKLFAEKITDNSPILGKKILEGGPDNINVEYQVVGTFEQYKYYNDFTEIGNQIFVRTTRRDTVKNLNTIVIKMKTSTNALFEQKLMSDLSRISPEWIFNVSLLKENKINANRTALGPFIIFSIIAVFLIFNVALGIFGVLWYSINSRRPEIGLRRAMGATASNIKKQFIVEMWMLASFALTIGIIISVQFPLLGVFNVRPANYIQSMVVAVLFISILVTVCAYRPSVIAAKIQPADTLREE